MVESILIFIFKLIKNKIQSIKIKHQFVIYINST